MSSDALFCSVFASAHVLSPEANYLRWSVVADTLVAHSSKLPKAPLPLGKESNMLVIKRNDADDNANGSCHLAQARDQENLLIEKHRSNPLTSLHC